MTSPASRASAGALEAVERILNRGGEPDAVRRLVAETLSDRTGTRIGIAREAPPEAAQAHDVVWEGRRVAALWAEQVADEALLARVAVIVAPYCRE